MAEFDKFTTDAQKAGAFVWKQDHLMRVATAVLEKQSNSYQRTASRGPAPKRQRRPNAKAAPDA